MPAFAADGSPDNWCREGHFPSYGNFQTGKLLGEMGAKIHFRGDDDDCPNDTPACQRKAYLIPGDEVVVAHRYQAFVCAWFQPKKGPPTVGWLPAVSVEVKKSATPTGLNALLDGSMHFVCTSSTAPSCWTQPVPPPLLLPESDADGWRCQPDPSSMSVRLFWY